MGFSPLTHPIIERKQNKIEKKKKPIIWYTTTAVEYISTGKEYLFAINGKDE
jgi:hypothetical protein